MTDAKRLHELVQVWHSAAQEVLSLLRSLGVDDWDKPTDLPGWNVRYVAAHLAHLESELAGMEQRQVQVPEAPHIKGLMGQFTEAGPLARATATTDDLSAELEQAVEKRFRYLTTHPPADPMGTADGFAGLVGWSWKTLLSNRPLDLWMHEQDIRRAVERPGGLDSPAAAHAADVFANSLSYVLGKRVGAPPGTSVVLDVSGPHARVIAAEVDEGGRGVLLQEPPPAPTTRLGLDFEDWIVLSGGRRPVESIPATIEGDHELGRQILAHLAVTP